MNCPICNEKVTHDGWMLWCRCTRERIRKIAEKEAKKIIEKRLEK